MAKNAQQFEERPWGTFHIVHEHRTEDGVDVVIKKMTIRPAKRFGRYPKN